MNVPLYIARKIASSSTSGYSGKIIRLAIASVSISMAVMILSTTVINGFKHEISEKIFGFWGNIHITDTRINRSFELSPVVYSPELVDSVMDIGGLDYSETFRDGSVRRTRTKGGVRDIFPFITLPAIMNNREDLEGIILKGVGPDYKWDDFSRYLEVGQFPGISDSLTSRDILVSQQTASRMRLNVGDAVILHFIKDRNSIKRKLNVSGIYRTGLEIYDQRFAFVDMGLIQGILGWDKNQIGGYEIFIEHIDDAFPIADYIYSEILPANLYAETIQEKFSNEFEWLKLQDINEAILIALMIIVAIINMSTAILILILERSRMIGILKSLGQTNWGIRKIFVYNAAWIMILSLLFGNLLGLGLAGLQKATGLLTLDETNYYLSEVPIRFDLLSILLINAGAVIVVSVVMILPTYLVTKVSPIRILRFE